MSASASARITPRRRALVAAVLTFAAHLVANPHYGFFRDELYFIICGRHPAFGYVDQPPVVPLLAAASQIFGASLVLLRAVPAAFAAASIYVTCRLTDELGGGAFAQWFAALCAALCPVLCNFGMKIGTDTPGLLLWPLIALGVVRLARGGDPRGWVAIGAALGIAMLSKYSAAYFAVALGAGLLATRERRILWSRWFVLGVAVAAVLALPNVLWQAARDFPMLELLRNGQHGKNVELSPLEFLVAELLITNPILAVVWVVGLVWCARHAPYLAVAFVVLMVAMIASHAKHYYPAAVYPILFAAGAVAIERAPRSARIAATALAATAGLVLVPYVEPILPTPTFLAYHHALAPILHTDAARTEHTAYSELPQDWADMHGWPELAATVGDIYRALPPDERARAAIVAANYGEAAAIDFFGRDLPPVLSGHNQYFLWGPHGASGDLVIDVHGDCGADLHLFARADLAATIDAPLAMPYEQHTKIYVCRGARVPLALIWPLLRFYY